MDLIRISWQEFDDSVKYLATQIEKDGKPEIIVGIPRGGLPLAVALSHYLDVPFHVASSGSSYALIADKDIVIVDDISDTGQELRQQLQHADRFGCTDVRTAVMVEREGTIQSATYSWKHLSPEDGWIIFPWERFDEVGKQKEVPVDGERLLSEPVSDWTGV